MCCKNKELCFTIFGWIFQLLTWTFLIISLLLYKVYLFVFLGLFYLIYIILEFCCPTSRYLCNKSTSEGIYQKMGIYYRTNPVIEWSCECYHYETYTYTSTDSQGNVVTHNDTRRVVTYSERRTMRYYSSRDVSGPFVLNCDEAQIKRKYYIKLELSDNIDFADALTVTDYQIQKNNFIAENQNRDAHFDFWEKRYIPGLIQYNLIKIGEQESGCANFFVYFIFTLITFAEFYKIYFNSLCVEQEYIIKKIISTRFNLNLEEYSIRYQSSIPSIDLINKQYYFKPSDYNYLNTSYKLDLPSREEVEKNNNNITIFTKNNNNINNNETNHQTNQDENNIILDNDDNYNLFVDK